MKGLDHSTDDGTFLRGNGDAGVLLIRSDHGWYAYLAVKMASVSPRLRGVMEVRTRDGWLVPLSQMPGAIRRDPEAAALHLHADSGALMFVFASCCVLTECVFL